VYLLCTGRIEPLGQSPRPMILGFFTQRTCRVMRFTRWLTVSFLPPLPVAFPAHSSRCRDAVTCFRPACSTIRLSDYSRRIASHFAFRLIGLLIPMPAGNGVSPPGSRSDLPYRAVAHTLVRRVDVNAFASIVQARLAPSLADRFIRGLAPFDYGPVLLSCPSDSTHGGHPALRLPVGRVRT